jgi:pyridoxal phosphate enzyme (YggS family)
MTENCLNDEKIAAQMRDLEENLKEVRERIAQAAVKSGRRPEDITLLAATKTVSPQVINRAIELGIDHIGENRVQELMEKYDALNLSNCSCQFIGHLQTNKLKLVLPYVSLVQSVDSLHLLQAIDRWGSEHDRVTDVLLELHLGAEETKQGFSEEEILSMVCPPACHYRIRGLMGMATNTDDAAVIEADFARIESLFFRIRSEHPELADTFTELSIGMSSDWPLAVRHGATMVRIGTDIFGPREY